jgi:salicylate hydroxylase
VNLIPDGIARFGKRLDNIVQNEESERLVMKFSDGTMAEADAIIGCDGIKPRVRQIILGDDHQYAHSVYTHKYAYRGLIPMEDAVATLGSERAHNACLYVRLPDLTEFP